MKAWLCFFRGHKWSRWSNFGMVGIKYARNCRTCGKVEVDDKRKPRAKRPATSADTVQGPIS